MSELELEKINSQRITGLDDSIKYVERKVDDLAKQLPNIVQDAVKQAVETFGFNKPYTNGNGNGNGKKESNPILAVLLTVVLALATIFGQQILFTYNQNEKTGLALREHIIHANEKDIDLAVLQERIEWVKKEAEKKGI